MQFDASKSYHVPSRCLACSTIYLTEFTFPGQYLRDGYTFDNGQHVPGRQIQFEKQPCPNCGFLNHPDVRLLEFVEDTVEALMQVPVESLYELQDTLQKPDPEEFTIREFGEAKDLLLAKAPGLDTVRHLAPQTRNEAFATFALILTMLGVSIEFLDNPQKTGRPSVLEVFQHANTAYGLIGDKGANGASSMSKNALCYCGSGKKYKRCHGLRA